MIPKYRTRRILTILACTFVALGLATASFAQTVEPPPLRFYSDDSALAQKLSGVSWRVPEDGFFDVLALSGGGPNGAFGAGVLDGWTKRGDRPVFDHVTGVSTGALIAPFAFLGPEWDDKLRAAYLDERASGLMKRRLLVGMFSDSIFSGRPLRDLVDSYVTPSLVEAVAKASESGRTLIIVTTDLRRQRSVAWDMGAIARLGGERARTLFRDVMLASASLPGVFPPVPIDHGDGGKELHFDGGIGTPIYAVPEALADLKTAPIGTRSPVRIFMIVNSSVSPVPDDHVDGTFDIMQRSLATNGKAAMRATLQLNAVIASKYSAAFSVISIPAGQSVPIMDFSQPSMLRLYSLGQSMGRDGYWRANVLEATAK